MELNERDIVERLQEKMTWLERDSFACYTLADAIAEIKRLRQEYQQLVDYHLDYTKTLTAELNKILCTINEIHKRLR